MTETFLTKVIKLTDNKINIYVIGILITFLITAKDVIHRTYFNFQIFSFGSTDFWTGNNPYTNWHHLSFIGKPLDYFLYSPQFSVLFTPFAVLPVWLGLFCWNIFSYTMFYFAVFYLPEQFTYAKKKFIFLYSLFLLLQALFSEQFNPIITALFLFSFTLLEKNKSFWAVFLILLSGFTKVYGFFQIGMLLFYPGLRKNILYTFITGIAFIFLPLVKIPLNELTNYYQAWFQTLMSHSADPFRFVIIYRPFNFLLNPIEPYLGIISAVVLVLLYLMVLLKLKLFRDSFLSRVQFLGILVVWAILFGTASERNTYHIAIAGYAMWYLCSQTDKIDKILLWVNFILLEIIPIDIFCPKVVSSFLLDELNIGIIVLAVTWALMVIKTFNANINSSFYKVVKADLI